MNLPQIDRVIRAALDEDLGSGDITSAAVVPVGAWGRARVTAKAGGVVAGIQVVRRVFELLEPEARLDAAAADGDRVAPGDVVGTLLGPARSLLAGERTALNFLQRLSGIATVTADVVARLSGRTRLLDTRKTTPGLRALEKAAVRAGGGTNHRAGLFDAVLIKNNHLKFASPAEAVRRARANAPSTAVVEIEVETFEQLAEALTAGPDIIMLDNMEPERMRQAMAMIAGRARVEVSGNVTADAVPELCALGVDYVSMGALTHSAPALDFSLRFEAFV